LEFEAVTDARLSVHVSRAVGLRLDLAPQVADVDLEQVALLLVPRSPHLRQQLPVSEYFPGMGD
jgi:hypothetical protein